MTKRIALRTALLLLVCTFLAAPAAAINRDVRLAILTDAVDLCPAELRTHLLQNWEMVKDGMLYADRYYRAYQDPETTRPVFDFLTTGLKQGPTAEATQFNIDTSFGVLACFVVENIYPGRIYIPDLVLIPEKVSYDGFNPLADPGQRTQELFDKFRRPYTAYTRLYRYVRFDYDVEQERFDGLYNRAVNEVVDYWISAWQAAGKEMGQSREAGFLIEHKLY